MKKLIGIIVLGVGMLCIAEQDPDHMGKLLNVVGQILAEHDRYEHQCFVDRMNASQR